MNCHSVYFSRSLQAVFQGRYRSRLSAEHGELKFINILPINLFSIDVKNIELFTS